MPYAIYPSIGVARLGNSPDAFFVSPEAPGSFGVEIDADGTERPVSRFKDANHRMKRQAARFRLFDVSNPAAPVEAQLPAGTVVRWTVTLANKKDAVVRPAGPPPSPVAVVLDPARADRIITATATVSGPAAPPAPLGGSYRGTAVSLGELRTDREGRLLVLGGAGCSETLATPPAPIGDDFYNNPDWFDDVGDGPVMAVVERPDQAPETARGAWALVGPPDFAPAASGVVTLYDMIRQAAIAKGWLQAPVPPHFDSDIRPMIARAASLRYVEDGAAWTTISQDWVKLSDPSAAARPLRQQTATLVREAENALHDFELTRWQADALDAWVAGQFQAGAAPMRGVDVLTRTALDGTVGQGFFPGIEAGINMTDPNRYEAADFDYRLSHAACRPGDMTALMALPWQADFLKCGQNWWPAQRPNRVMTMGGARRPWLRPQMNHARLVKDAMQLGVVAPDGSGAVLEQDRDPALGP